MLGLRGGRRGTALVKSEDPQPRPDRATLGRLLALARPYARRLVLAAVSMVVGSLLSLAMPWLIQHLIDSVMLQQSAELLGQVAVGLVGVFLVQAGFNFVQSYQLAFTGERLVADLRRKLFAHLQTL